MTSELDPLNIIDELLAGTSWIAKFREEPVTIEEFATSAEHMKNVSLSPKQIECITGWLGSDPVTMFDKHSTRKNLSVWALGKGCLVGDSLICLPDGSVETVEALAARGEDVVVRTADLSSYRLVRKTVAAPFLRGRGECFEVETTTGRKLKVFSGHLFLTVASPGKWSSAQHRGKRTEEWKPLAELAVGSNVALATTAGFVGSVHAPDEARYVGYLLGDGCAASTDSLPSIKAESEEVRQDIRELYTRLTGKAPSEWPDRTCMFFGSAFTPWETRRGENAAYEVCKRLELLGKVASTKRIPAECFKYDAVSLWNLLSGLWLTDGWVCQQKQDYACWEAGYGSVSRELVEDIAALMQRLGIVASVRRHVGSYHGEPYISWSVSVHMRRFLLPFLRGLALVGPKAEKATAAIEQLSALPTSGRGVYQKGNEAIYWDKIKTITPIGEHDYYDFEVPETENYEAHGFLNHNSGKNMMGTIVQAYVLYVLLCMRDPLGFFGFPQGESIDMVNVASSAVQAKRNFFDKFTRRVLRWKWLRERFQLVKAGKPVNDTPANSWGTINITEDSVEYNGGIKCISAHSDSKGYEGYSPVLWVMDEASSWETEYVQLESGEQAAISKAHAIFDTLRTSAVSRSWKWAGLIISYPRQEDDFTLGMANDILEGKIDGHAVIAATWEVKPWHLWSSAETFEHKIVRPHRTWSIFPPKDFEEEFRLYPQQSELKYACVPSRTKAYFIYNNIKIHECADEKIIPLARLHKIDILSPTPDGSKQTKYTGFDILDIMEPDPNYDYYCHIDLSISSDTAVLGIGHGEPYEADVMLSDEAGNIEHEEISKRVVIDQLIAWQPDNDHLVSHVNIDEVIKKLDDKLHFRFLSYDQFQSHYVLEKAARKGRVAGKHNVSNKDYFLLRGLIHTGIIRYPKHPVLILELEKLIWTGKRVDHQAHIAGKDFCDVVAGIASSILNEMGEKKQKFTFHFPK